jgi:hypothetical protein
VSATASSNRSFDSVWLVGGRSLDHLCFALDGDERIRHVSLHEQKARVLIIMANSATEMILTPRWYTVAQVAQLLNNGESKGSHADHHWRAAVDQGWAVPQDSSRVG